MIELESFNIKLWISGDLSVERLFKIFSIPSAVKLRFPISGKLGSKLGDKVFLSLKKVKN